MKSELGRLIFILHIGCLILFNAWFIFEFVAADSSPIKASSEPKANNLGKFFFWQSKGFLNISTDKRVFISVTQTLGSSENKLIMYKVFATMYEYNNSFIAQANKSKR